MSGSEGERIVHINLAVAGDELDLLEGALLAARAGELSMARRRGARHAMGYGSDAARETMIDEVEQAQRRYELLDRLLRAHQRAR